MVTRNDKLRWIQYGKSRWKRLPHVLLVADMDPNYAIDVVMQERRNSIADAMELRLSCTNPSIWAATSKTTIHQIKNALIMQHESGIIVSAKRQICRNRGVEEGLKSRYYVVAIWTWLKNLYGKKIMKSDKQHAIKNFHFR